MSEETDKNIIKSSVKRTIGWKKAKKRVFF